MSVRGRRSLFTRRLAVVQSAGFAAPDIGSTGFENGGWDSPFSDISGLGNEVIVADATAIGGHSLQLNWVSGAEMSAGAEANFPGSTTALCFLRFRFKQTVGFDNSGIKKICRFQGAGFNGLFGTLINNHGQYDWVWDGDSADNLIASPNIPDNLQGAWHYMEVMNDLRVDGNLKAKIWLDGALVLDVTSTHTYGGVTIGACDVMGIFNTPAATGTEWLDQIAISTQRIGP